MSQVLDNHNLPIRKSQKPESEDHGTYLIFHLDLELAMVMHSRYRPKVAQINQAGKIFLMKMMVKWGYIYNGYGGDHDTAVTNWELHVLKPAGMYMKNISQQARKVVIETIQNHVNEVSKEWFKLGLVVVRVEQSTLARGRKRAAIAGKRSGKLVFHPELVALTENTSWNGELGTLADSKAYTLKDWLKHVEFSMPLHNFTLEDLKKLRDTVETAKMASSAE